VGILFEKVNSSMYDSLGVIASVAKQSKI
jgi:hypothetical protein